MKNCLIVLKNKKLDIVQAFGEDITKNFSSAGYWFDKITFASYDSGEEITRQIRECKDCYENIVIVYPEKMAETLKKYISGLYGAQFVGYFLCASNQCVFLAEEGNLSKISKEIIRSLNERYKVRYDKAYLKTVGATAEEINGAVAKAKEICPSLEYNVYGKFGENTIEILYSSVTPKMTLDDITRVLMETLGDYVYALENVTLAERLYQLLILRRMKICVAESFTGGGICQKLVEVPGVSKVFYEGLNTYSNESKAARLGVKDLTLKQHGAVSAETAYEMAEGLIAQGNCDISIATTGIAGPKSDGTKKPVGLCYIGVGVKDNVFVTKYVLSGGRENITKTAVNLALFLAYKQLK